MIRTREYLHRQREALLRKHPGLEALRIVTVKAAGWDHWQASAFIESCWRDYYRAEESRMVFSPEFLEWQLPKLGGICALSREGKPVGCLLLFPRSYLRNNGSIPAKFTLSSCLSILPDHRGQGIAQLMALAVQERDLAKGFAFSCCYIDQRKAGPGSSFQIWGTSRSRAYALHHTALLAKSFDWRKARAHGPLNVFTTAIVLVSQWLFPARQGQRFSRGRQVEEGNRKRLPAVRKLLAAADRSLLFRRIYGETELARMITFRKDTFSALSYVLIDEAGRADAFLWGYKLPLGGGVLAFFADGVVFRPGLRYRLKWAFFSECEGRLRDGEGCIGVTLLSTASGENLLKFGYVPYDRQLLGMDLYDETGLQPEHLRDLRIELR